MLALRSAEDTCTKLQAAARQAQLEKEQYEREAAQAMQARVSMESQAEVSLNSQKRAEKTLAASRRRKAGAEKGGRGRQGRSAKRRAVAKG